MTALPRLDDTPTETAITREAWLRGRQDGPPAPRRPTGVPVAPSPDVDAWRAEAACLGMDTLLFFPGRAADCAPAKRVCAGCAVRADCLEDALASREAFGVRGGLSERQRRRLRSQRAVSARLRRSPVLKGAQ